MTGDTLARCLALTVSSRKPPAVNLTWLCSFCVSAGFLEVCALRSRSGMVDAGRSHVIGRVSAAPCFPMLNNDIEP